VLFLPGAAGLGSFWQPLAERLPEQWRMTLLDWPGLGDVPSDPRVRSFDDLANLVIERLETPADLVAQSMGGLVAMKVALARPEAVRRLVLVATSGGLDVRRFQAADWRMEYRAEFPNALPFVTDERQEDLTDQLPRVTAPSLLLWARGDTISPPGVGEFLAQKLSGARVELKVLEFEDHAFARDHAGGVPR
jgi:pimeloyl-ACP methyl ester carboxylesterase